ncbi:hypothetical protein RRG08_065546 [Elysia crispata]|uniref:Uncharacterized protein n=1 Tax=Elysia crispata TaxID=231223 RepID=A0AAE1ATV8_9GAST|nr:hypothetical protein RRG08_065546 [Elysia crispata]
MDGFKPGQRKVIFTCIKRNLTTKELKDHLCDDNQRDEAVVLPPSFPRSLVNGAERYTQAPGWKSRSSST